MYTISIHERGGETDSPNAAVSINDEGEYPITVRNPFSPQEEARLEWYFERRLRFPFTDQVEAQAAAASVAAYGESLFNQVFADRKAYARYREALQSGVENLRFEISGSPEFHQLHWQALKDPELPQPLTLQAPMIRRTPKTQTLAAAAQTLPTINLLLVVARPDEGRDVGYRTISRPLVEMLRQSHLRLLLPRRSLRHPRPGQQVRRIDEGGRAGRTVALPEPLRAARHRAVRGAARVHLPGRREG
jgi:hypothetical protein